MSGELSPDALELFVEDLNPYPLEVIAHALARTRKELEFWPRTIKPILERCEQGLGSVTPDAEALAAWDQALQFARAWVQVNPHGAYVVLKEKSVGPMIERDGKFYLKHANAPTLSDRILDCVRLLGGWGVLHEAHEGNVAFIRRDFVSSFKVWSTVQGCGPAKTRELFGEAFKRLISRAEIPGSSESQ